MDTNQLKGKKIVITGASSGLGLAMAEAMAEALGKAGAAILVTARDTEKLSKALTRLENLQIDAHSLPLDVRSEQSIENAVNWIAQKWGRLDVLINNAGIGMRTVNPDFLSEPQPFFKVSSQQFRDLIDTNLTGYFLVSKAFIPLFIKQQKGKIINISISHETMRRKGFIPYGPSRAGTESLSLIMAEDLKEYHIDVNMLLPGGATNTGMVPDEFKERLKLLDPGIMAEPAIFLASDESDGITGERIIAVNFSTWKSSLATK